jgi:predicted phage terminase large subunit-like protein
MEYPDLKARFLRQAADWKPAAILVEDKASGQSLIQDVRRETTLPVLAIQPKGDKLIRAAGVSAMVEAGKVFLPRHAPWLADFEIELLTFPNAPHDDQTDSTTQFLEWMRLRASPDRPMIRRL